MKKFFLLTFIDNDYSFGFNIQDEFELVEEPASEDLEKAATRAAYHQYQNRESDYISENEKKKFIEGAQWKKQQMLAKAIDAHIVLGPNNNHVLMNGRFNKFKWNDKVKIIIIEEDKI